MTLTQRIMKAAETWRPVPGTKRYMISDHGNVMSMGRRNSGFRMMPVTLNAQGYPYVSINRKARRIHQLVILVFGPPKPSDKHCVAHLDDIKTNNHISNLVWATTKENAQHAIRNNRLVRGSKHGRSKLNDEAMVYIYKNYFRNGPIGNAKQLAKRFGVHYITVSRAYNRMVRGEYPHLTALAKLENVIGGEK